jgi:hypothetical protein
MSTLRLRANDAALLTRPSSSAPLKFLVVSARRRRSTSGARNELASIWGVGWRSAGAGACVCFHFGC